MTLLAVVLGIGVVVMLVTWSVERHLRINAETKLHVQATTHQAERDELRWWRDAGHILGLAYNPDTSREIRHGARVYNVAREVVAQDGGAA